MRALLGGVVRIKTDAFPPPGMELEEDLRDQLSGRHGSQRCLVGESELLLILHQVPAAGVPEREPLVFWQRPEHGWVGPDLEPGLGALAALLDRYQAVIDEYEEVIDGVERAAQVFRIARHAVPLRRSSRNLARALDRAVDRDEDNRELIGLRDRAWEIERAAELLYLDARLTLEFTQAENAEEHQQSAERLNVIAYRLNLMAGFFLPLVAFGGLFGMNVQLPDFVKPLFWGIFTAGLSVGAAILWLVSRKPMSKR